MNNFGKLLCYTYFLIGQSLYASYLANNPPEENNNPIVEIPLERQMAKVSPSCEQFYYSSTHQTEVDKVLVELYKNGVDIKTLALFNKSQKNNKVIPRKKSPIAFLSIEERYSLLEGYSKSYHMPIAILKILYSFISDHSQYKGKRLPKDLSGYNLSQFDFTGCHFTHTKLDGAILENVNLEDTICDYQDTFNKNIYGKCEVYYYRGNLPEPLKEIGKLYPFLNNSQKAKLLSIASGFAYLPFCQEKKEERYIKFNYYVARLLDLKEKEKACQGLLCPLENIISYIFEEYCWTTTYTRSEKSTHQMLLHSNFEEYLDHFENGHKKYNVMRKYPEYFLYYQTAIMKSILGLKLSYPFISTKKNEREASKIGYLLSISYQYEGIQLFKHYMCCQNSLFELKQKLINTEAALHIYYAPPKIPIWDS